MSYATIVADPPWQYRDTLVGLNNQGAESNYRVMDLTAIRDLPVASYMAENAHCYLWTTNPFLREAFDVLESWGFEYKTCLTWVKTGLGLGRYFRGNTEHVLFGVRGRLMLARADQPNVFESEAFNGQRRRHSEKPESFYDMVESVSPGPYLELFARRTRLGWDTIGDGVGVGFEEFVP